MKYIAALSFLLLSGTSQGQPDTTINLTTDEGYPYKNLIKKAQRVELRYIESEHSVKCKVSVQTSHNQYVGKEQIVSPNTFKKQPMAACLTRAKAKQILNMM